MQIKKTLIDYLNVGEEEWSEGTIFVRILRIIRITADKQIKMPSESFAISYLLLSNLRV
jgi:hypothetical protein